MRKTGNYGWWASGALTVALLAVAALVTWSQNAQAGLNCQDPKYWDGRKCNTRQIAIDTIIGYYKINMNRQDRGYGCNWYRTLVAFDRDGKFVPSHSNSSVRGSTILPPGTGNPPTNIMQSPPANLVRNKCDVGSPLTVGEARANQRVWSGWSPVAAWLAAEAGRTTKECPNGSIIASSQQCPEPRKMLACWDGSQIVARPEQWDNDAAQLDSECPRHTVKPAISISVDGGVDEGQAHTWTLTASPAPTRDVTVTVKFRAEGDRLNLGGSRWEVAMFGDVGRRNLFNGRAYLDRTGPPVTLPAGQTSVRFTGLGSMQDKRRTADSKVTATVVAGNGYTLGSPHEASAPVWDDDAPQPLTINLPTVTIREGGWAPIVVSVPAAGSSSNGTCVHGRITLRPESGGQPDSSDYRTWYIGDEAWICASIRPQPYAQSGFIMALRDHHDDAGERLIVGWEQTDGDGTVTVNEGSVTITNDGPLPAEWLARVGHGVAGQVVESVAARVFANRSPGEVEGSLGAMPAKDRPVTDGDALLIGSSASMTSHDGALAMWARADGTSFSSMTGGDGDVTTGHAGMDYVDGPLMFGLALARSEAEGTYRGGGGRMTSTIWRAT